MKTLFIILSTNKYKNTRQKALRETWLAGQDYFFASDIDDGDQIKLSNKTDHSSAEEKQLYSFSHIVNNDLNYGHYFFCDDDTSVNINLWSAVKENYFDKNIGWIISRESDPRNPIWQKESNFRYFSGGAGFILSKNSVRAIAEFVPHYSERSRYGDISVGKIIEKLGIPIVHSDLFHGDKPATYNHNKIDIKNNLTYHYVADAEMRSIYEIQNLP